MESLAHCSAVRETGPGQSGVLPRARGWSGRALAPAILAAAACAATAVHFAAVPLPYDDAFITFRYVENLIAGKGLVYNEGHRVQGFSTVTYLFWLVGLKSLFSGSALPVLAVRANAVPFVASGLAAYLLLRRMTSSRIVASSGAALLLVHPVMLAVSVGGMEVFLFVTFLLFACVAMADDRPVALGALAALALLTRPEAVVLLPVALVAYWGRWRRLAIAVGAFLPLVAIWSAFALAYYGTLLPCSVEAKMKPLYPMPAGDALASIVAALGEALSGRLLAFMPQLRIGLVMSLVIVATAACAFVRPRRTALAWAAPMLFWTFLALYLWGNPLMFHWYWPPVFFAAMLTVIAGAAGAAQELRASLSVLGRERMANRAHTAVLVLAFAWLGATAALCYSDTQVNLNRSVRGLAEDAGCLRIVGYERAAKELNSVVAPGERVAASEVGSLGYYFKGYLIDACGLVSPEALPYLPVPADERLGPGSGAISVELVEGTRPEWVVTMPVFAAKSLLVSGAFQRSYVHWASVPLPKACWGSDKILIFRRRTAP